VIFFSEMDGSTRAVPLATPETVATPPERAMTIYAS
jgi:hypothetical protein